jgi:ferredoxin--NADP+ reductase
VPRGSLRVAVVGAGPAACYAASELLGTDGVEVNIFERLPTPFGLIRAGVAPDHQHTKSVVKIFESAFRSDRFGCHLNVEVGDGITHDALLAHHHAVLYAVGASASRELHLPGAQLPGSHAAADFVGWYNGHPDHAGHEFDLSGERAVIVGNGNVALDVARILLMSPEELAQTDIADHALEALSDSNIREVVILGRRQLRDAAFSVGEFLALGHLPDVDVLLHGADLEPDPDDDVETATKLSIAADYAERPARDGNKRIVFRFLTSPTAFVGEDRLEGLRVAHNRIDDAGEIIDTALVLRSIGYHGVPIPGLEYDGAAGVIPNADGRVLDAEGQPRAGVYVAGWIKRGPRGVIGTNRACAENTVAQLWADYDSGVLARDIADADALKAVLAERGIASIDWRGWKAIDAAERERGTQASRPRVKFVSVDELRATAAS